MDIREIELTHHATALNKAAMEFREKLRLARRAGLRVSVVGKFQGQDVPLPADGTIMVKVGLR